ncbi:TetR family transcriptional regulator [Croceicoccus sp. F390]|uniref:TetR family transcriptional regulator n=1 Tax=Croceicoccus esteveae TaxID=3075597 RepID=A0ABU2ZGZ8_9SPHN|nr:TetR family transcriptional regulator [Croceicoccus sp. F390]MDT0575876.1 TetR family transcriptional regulator [Croceicoccus sp. F390]
MSSQPVATDPRAAAAAPERRNLANQRQKAQRLRTRERLIDGAIAVFSSRGYADTTTADILQSAGVSRASFYAHFAGKGAVAGAIADRFAPVWQPLYAQLCAFDRPLLEPLTRWCGDHVQLYREHQAVCIILTQAAAIERSLYWQLAAAQDRLIDELAQGRMGLDHLAHDEAARTRAALALSQIDHACYFLAIRRWDIDPQAGIAEMGMQLCHFLEQEVARGRPAAGHGGIGSQRCAGTGASDGDDLY